MILVVDDEPTSVRLIEMALRRENYPVVTAQDGEAALRLLEKEQACDLVISDVRMPKVGGSELVRKMRADTRWAPIPVIMCTSVADRTTVVDLIGQGVRDYVVKPVTPSVLMPRVRSALAGERAVIEPRSKTIERLEISPLEYTPLVRETVPTIRALADELSTSMRSRNSRGVRAVAERVREPAAVFGARRCYSAAARVLLAMDELEILHCGGMLVSEVAEVRGALERAALACPM
jgi:twitching motility two-component system response regulator PilH